MYFLSRQSGGDGRVLRTATLGNDALFCIGANVLFLPDNDNQFLWQKNPA